MRLKETYHIPLNEAYKGSHKAIGNECIKARCKSSALKKARLKAVNEAVQASTASKCDMALKSDNKARKRRAARLKHMG